MKVTGRLSWALACRQLIILLGLQCLASLAWALSTPVEWSTSRGGRSACTGCHDSAGANYSPIYSTGPSSALRTAIQTQAAFYTYVSSTMGGNSSAMSGVDSGDAEVIRRFLLQRLYGEFTSPSMASANPPSYSRSFGAVTVGAQANATLTLSNARNTAITYSWSGIGSSSASDFWLDSEGCTPTRQVTAGGTCSMSLHFSPTTTGARSDTLNITVDGLTQTISLSGTGQAPSYSAGSSNLAIIATMGGSNSASTTLSNSGSATLTLASLSISGAAAGDFAFGGSNTCIGGLGIGPGGSCTLHITFTPTALGARNAAVSVTHNATGSPSSITLSGTANAAPAPSISANASSLAFTNTQLGASQNQIITVTNNGTAALSFSSLAISGAQAADFSRSGSCSTAASLAVSAQCTIGITFAPSALGARAASLAVNSNASNGNLSVPLSGTGVPVPAPLVSLSASALAVGNQSLGGAYAPRQVTLSNTGTAALAISALSVGAGAFSLVDAAPCGSALAAGASCNIRVQFTPTAAGTDYTGTLSLASNATGSPHTVALSGHGTTAAAPVLVWSPAPSANTLNFGSVPVGSASAPRTVTVSNQGPGAATVNLVQAVGLDAAQFTVTPVTCTVSSLLYEGSSCDLTVTFSPGLPGIRNAQLEFGSTGSPPATLTLTGVGSGGPTPMAALSGSSLAFGEVRVGTRSAPLEVTLSSSGSGTLQVTTLATTGPFVVSSKTCPALPFDLPSGSQCVLAVSYQATGTGTQTGSLTVASNAANGQLSAALSGQGQAAVDTSNGGCSIARGDSLLDPTLWLLALAAALVLWRRRVQASPPTHTPNRERVA